MVLPLVGVGALVVVISAAGGGQQASGNGPAAEADQGRTVVYEVTGDGRAMITHATDASGSMAQSTQELPYSSEVSYPDAFAPLTVSATRSLDGGTGSLGCRITVDGEVVTENHSDGGPYASVTCNGTL